jgi:D-sedoheptulose 7-phosphate isomerase
MNNNDKEDSGHYKFEKRGHIGQKLINKEPVEVRNLVDENCKNFPVIMEEFKAAYSLLENVMSDTGMMASIAAAAEIMHESISKGGKIIICGNGGSMCDAMHFAAELTGKLSQDRPPIPAIAISDPAHLSCVANDYGYQRVFSRYIDAHTKKGDVVVVITTSGNSDNIAFAAIMAQSKGCVTIALTGNHGGRLRDKLDIGRGEDSHDVEICVPGMKGAALTQQIHITIIHILCALVEQKLWPYLKPE